MELWTSATPNGWKVSIMIEELIEAGIDMSHVKVRHINLAKGEQFSKRSQRVTQIKRFLS
jgi:GST-like protein